MDISSLCLWVIGGGFTSLRSNAENIPTETLLLRILPDAEKDSNLKVYVSFHKIAFSAKRAGMDDGVLVSGGVYFSPLAHLLYAYNAVGGKDFEESKERARSELRGSIDARKSRLERAGDHTREIQLLQRALLLL